MNLSLGLSGVKLCCVLLGTSKEETERSLQSEKGSKDGLPLDLRGPGGRCRSMISYNHKRSLDPCDWVPETPLMEIHLGRLVPDHLGPSVLRCFFFFFNFYSLLDCFPVSSVLKDP